MSNIFFERYSELCNSVNGTPNSIAKELGISSGSVTAWKNGTEPRPKTLDKIADYFETTVDYLLGRTDDSENSDRFGLEDPADQALNYLHETRNAPTRDGGRKPDVLDEVDIAFYGEYKQLTEDDKDTIRDMVRVMRERRAKKQE